MTEPDPNYLFNLADAVLGAVEDYYSLVAVDDLAASALPTRRYVSNGLVAWDEEQVTVKVMRRFSRDATGLDSGSFPVGPVILRGCEMVIQILRCVPGMADDLDSGGAGAAPTPQELGDSAKLILADAELVDHALIAGYKEGSLPGCSGLYIVGWMQDGPEGLLAGGSTTVRVMLD